MDEELLQRQAPQALEAEQSVLGSMLIDERCVPDVVGMLQPDDFYLRQNREIYETIYTMFNFSEKIDPVTVLNKMKERGVYDEQRSYDYIAQLLKITPTAANVKQYCTIVHDKSLLRALATASSEITEMVYDGVGTAQEMLEVSEKKIYSLRRGNTGDSLQHIGKVMINVYDRLEELAASGSEIPGLSTGLHDLDFADVLQAVTSVCAEANRSFSPKPGTHILRRADAVVDHFRDLRRRSRQRTQERLVMHDRAILLDIGGGRRDLQKLCDVIIASLLVIHAALFHFIEYGNGVDLFREVEHRAYTVDLTVLPEIKMVRLQHTDHVRHAALVDQHQARARTAPPPVPAGPAAEAAPRPDKMFTSFREMMVRRT